MAGSDSFEIPFRYSEDDLYIRAVRLYMIRGNGEIMPGAFKSRHGGLSVTRTNRTVKEYALAYMNAHFEGRMAMFSRIVCEDCAIFEKHSPSPGHNLHHWELYGDDKEAALTDDQVLTLVKESVIVQDG